MTEKRFTIIDGIKKGTHSGIWDNQKQNNQRIGDELWVGEVVAMLNEGVMIVEENEQLKDKYNEQSVEYEGLEEQVERLLDFKDNVFNIITKKIKNGEQAIEWGESIGANVGAMGFHIEMLKMLLKELQE